MDKAIGPLSTICVKNLTDKIYDKRKSAALEIEKIIRDLFHDNKTEDINGLLDIFNEDFIKHSNPNVRKGGLIALAAAAIALGKESQRYVEKLFHPVSKLLDSDKDSRVRYYACESLYNIVKVTRSSIIPHFSNLFGVLARCADDPESNIRKGSEMLDKLLKDIVIGDCDFFPLEEFIGLARDSVYTKMPNLRQFIVAWLHSVHSSPKFTIIPYLPELLDGLFEILGDLKLEIRKSTQNLLDMLLKDIKEAAARSEEINYKGFINILVIHCNGQNDCVKWTGMVWLTELTPLCAGTVRTQLSSFLQAILPSLQLCTTMDPTLNTKMGIGELARRANATLLGLVSKEDVLPESAVEPLVTVLLHSLLSPESTGTTMSVSLSWFKHLLANCSGLLSPYIGQIFPVLVKTLGDTTAEASPDLLSLNLAVLAEFSSSSALRGAGGDLLDPVSLDLRSSLSGEHPCFIRLVHELVRLFSVRSKLSDSAHIIVTHLCQHLSAYQVYYAFAQIIIHNYSTDDSSSREFDIPHTELAAAFDIVSTLNLILLSDATLYTFRQEIHALSTKETRNLFAILYKAWCHNPAATLSLCLLSRNYSHANRLVSKFSAIEITTPLLIELDKLVQLLESPIFLYLRLDLLNTSHSLELSSALFGLLMCLPQTEAFSKLHRRLTCMPQNGISAFSDSEKPRKQEHKIPQDMGPLLEYFSKVQETHRLSRLRASTVPAYSLQNGVKVDNFSMRIRGDMQLPP